MPFIRSYDFLTGYAMHTVLHRIDFTWDRLGSAPQPFSPRTPGTLGSGQSSYPMSGAYALQCVESRGAKPP